MRRGATVPTDCVELCSSSKLSAFARGNDTMMVARRLYDSKHPSPIDERNIAPPVSVPDRGGRSLQTPSWMSVFTGPTRHQTGLTGQKKKFCCQRPSWRRLLVALSCCGAGDGASRPVLRPFPQRSPHPPGSHHRAHHHQLRALYPGAAAE